MFFGSMLVLISVDLIWEWLVMASAKMMAAEYAVCVATFMAVMAMGIEAGGWVVQSHLSQTLRSIDMCVRSYLACRVVSSYALRYDVTLS